MGSKRASVPKKARVSADDLKSDRFQQIMSDALHVVGSLVDSNKSYGSPDYANHIQQALNALDRVSRLHNKKDNNTE